MNICTKEELKKDLYTLKIENIDSLTTRYVTINYKRLAKEKHPDREGGVTSDFQELQAAYKRVFRNLEDFDQNEVHEEDFEKDFIMQNNVMKECTSSVVVNMKESFVNN